MMVWEWYCTKCRFCLNVNMVTKINRNIKTKKLISNLELINHSSIFIKIVSL